MKEKIYRVTVTLNVYGKNSRDEVKEYLKEFFQVVEAILVDKIGEPFVLQEFPKEKS